MKSEQTLDWVELTVALPIQGHNGNTLRNLINMIHARAAMINRAIGTRFWVDDGLIEWISVFDHTKDLDTLYKAVETYEAEFGKSADGIEVRRDRIIFGTFRKTSDPGLIKTYAALCAMMNKHALSEQFISSEPQGTGNEKLDMRNWLRAIGMGGPNYKMERSILTFPLLGFIDRV